MEKSIVYEMSQSESLIMNFLWREGAKTFIEIMTYLNHNEGRDWKNWYDNWEQDGRTESDVKYDAYEGYVNADNVIFFVSEEGEVYYDVHTDANQMYRACSHTYVSGTVANHEKDGKGGCKMDYYAGQRCTKCGYVVYGDLVRTVSYTVCPH